MTTLTQLYGTRNGMNIDNLEVTTDEEIDSFLNAVRKARGAARSWPAVRDARQQHVVLHAA